LTGCSTSYRGIYWIKSDAGESPSIKQQQAIAVREAVLRVANEVGFTVTESAAKSSDSILPGFIVIVPKEGLKEPYKALGGAKVHVSLSVAFIHPYSIAITDDGNASESELVRRIKALLEDELAKVKPPVEVSYRVDRMRLD